MNPFDYARPASIEEAVSLGGQAGTAYFAGGTNLVDLMKTGAARPGRLVDVSRVPDLDRIEELPDGGYRVGAMMRNSDLARDKGFARAFPAASEALLAGASPQLRNAATVGGNLLQHTRCTYFFQPESRCNRRDPRSGCDALEGVNAGHAVLGWSEGCIAVNPSDLCVTLTMLDAVVEIAGAGGRREVAARDFHNLPGDQPERETALKDGELVIALRFPAASARLRAHSRYLKVRERTSYAFALVSAAVGLELEGDTIRTARLALGGVAARPWRVSQAEDLMVGKKVSEEVFEAASAAMLEGARPSGNNAYKIQLARRTLVRALELAAAGTPEAAPALPASVFA